MAGEISEYQLIIRMLAQQQDLLHKLLNQRKDNRLKPARAIYRLRRRVKDLEIQLALQKEAYNELEKFAKLDNLE